MEDKGHLMDDAGLVAQTLAGDREAFGRLYDRYARLVRAVAFGGSRDLATVQDVTQECFMRAFRQLSTLRSAERFGAWIVGIARQTTREYHRRRRLKLLGESTFELPSVPTAVVDDADEMEHVLQLVSRLPEEERLAVHLFFLGERDVNATAKLLNRSRSGTYALLKRACARLARRLKVPDQQREVEL
jgi:RNA polymerase sigma-70 factor (ECF subfamily)